jgi:hypothetical protein
MEVQFKEVQDIGSMLVSNILALGSSSLFPTILKVKMSDNSRMRIFHWW